MTRQTFLCLVACLVLAITLVYAHGTAVRGEQNPPATHKDEDEILKDQIVMIEFRSTDGGPDSIVIANARVAKLGQREFLMGDGYAPEGSDVDWYADMQIGVPSEEIVRFESMTPERYKEYLKTIKEHSKE
jgi:hypothetical protein